MQITGLHLAGVTLVPGPMKRVVWLIAWLLLYSWGRSCWREFTSSTGVSMFPWEKETVREAFRIYTFWVTLPGFFLISLGTGWILWGWAGLVAGAVAALSSAGREPLSGGNWNRIASWERIDGKGSDSPPFSIITPTFPYF